MIPVLKQVYCANRSLRLGTRVVLFLKNVGNAKNKFTELWENIKYA